MRIGRVRRTFSLLSIATVNASTFTAFDRELFDRLTGWLDQSTAKRAAVRFEFGVGRPVPSGIRVTPRVQKRQFVVPELGFVGVAEDDEVGCRLPAEHRHVDPGSAVSVDDADPEPFPLDHALFRDPVANRFRIVVADDAPEITDRIERVEDRRRHEITGVDDHVCGFDGLESAAVETVGFTSVGIGEDDEHTVGRKYSYKTSPNDRRFASSVVLLSVPTPTTSMLTAGVIAVQGDVAEHAVAIREAAERRGEPIDVRDVRTRGVVPECDLLSMPGGESTTISRLLFEEGIDEEVIAHAAAGKPILATCAGLIVASRDAADDRVRTLGLLDVSVDRNAFGRQKDSFEAPLDIGGLEAPFPAVFIRAPVIDTIGDEVTVLAEWNGKPVAVRQGSIVATAFHPELTADSRLHELAFFADAPARREPTQ